MLSIPRLVVMRLGIAVHTFSGVVGGKKHCAMCHRLFGCCMADIALREVRAESVVYVNKFIQNIVFFMYSRNAIVVGVFISKLIQLYCLAVFLPAPFCSKRESMLLKQ